MARKLNFGASDFPVEKYISGAIDTDLSGLSYLTSAEKGATIDDLQASFRELARLEAEQLFFQTLLSSSIGFMDPIPSHQQLEAMERQLNPLGLVRGTADEIREGDALEKQVSEAYDVWQSERKVLRDSLQEAIAKYQRLPPASAESSFSPEDESFSTY